MFRSLSVFLALFSPTVALAHPGHLSAFAGHSHWLALAAFCVAMLIGGFVWRKSRNQRKDLTIQKRLVGKQT